MSWRLLCFVALVACQDDPPDKPRDNGDPPTEDDGPRRLFLTQWDAVDDPPLPHGKQFEVRFNRPALLHIKCRGEDDGEEEHLWWSTEMRDHFEVSLWGLLPDIRYDCSFEGTDGEVVANITHRTSFTGPIPVAVPDLEVAEWDALRSWGAYTLFNHFDTDAESPTQTLLLVDPEGGVRWHHVIDDAGETVEVAYAGDGLVLAAGGDGLAPTLIDLAGQVVYTAAEPAAPGAFHHDAQVLASGDIAALSSVEQGGAYGAWLGAGIEVRTPFTDALTWSWDSSAAFAQGQLPGGGDDDPDPYGANAVSLVDEADGPAAYLSLSALDRIVRVDRATGDISWQLGAGLDFALVAQDGSPLGDDAWFYGQHAPQIDLPQVLVYDNGVGRDPPWSRAVELELDLDTNTAQIVWEYHEDGWFEPLWGDADRLGNGNVLIAMGHCHDCDPATGGLDRQSAIVEVDRDTGEVVWRLVLTEPTAGLYRANRLDGCALFLNGKYCDSLADAATF